MIADFVINKMSGYIAGGMKPETAAGFTRGEMLAIYRRQHHSRDKSGAWQITPPLENIPATVAIKKADAAIAEILIHCAHNAEKGQPLNRYSPGNNAISGFDKMAEYARQTV